MKFATGQLVSFHAATNQPRETLNLKHTVRYFAQGPRMLDSFATARATFRGFPGFKRRHDSLSSHS